MIKVEITKYEMIFYKTGHFEGTCLNKQMITGFYLFKTINLALVYLLFMKSLGASG